jgi:hypothetical protein
MKILLWGCISSPWTVGFIQGFLLKYNYEVWVLRTGIEAEYRDFYEKKNIHIIEPPARVVTWYKDGKKGNFLKTIYMYFLQIKAVIKEGKFDIINLHYIELFHLFLVNILRTFMGSKVILSYWGSDLLRAADRELHREGLFVKHADFVTFENGDLRIKFEKTYQWSDRINTETIFFGLPVLDIIREKQRTGTNEDIRRRWKIPDSKKILAIGHNAARQQRHLDVLSVIARLNKETKDKLFILLQMSYGGTEEYKNKVTWAVKDTGCEYLIVDRFLTDEEVAELRIITDLFVHAQVTDAFSGSVCENLFAETLLINARWLHYQEFNDYDFKYIEFVDFNEISGIVERFVGEKADVSGNRDLMWRLRAWENCAPQWEKIYRKVLSNYEKCVGDRG